MLLVSYLSNYVLPVSPETGGSPRLIYNLPGSCQVYWCLCDFQKEYNCFYSALLYILHYTCLNDVYFSLEYCVVEPKTAAVPYSWAPSIHSGTSDFIGLWHVGEIDQSPFFVCVNPACHSHLSENLTVNGLWFAFLGSIMSSLICRVGSYAISRNILVWQKLVDLELNFWAHMGL